MDDKIEIVKNVTDDILSDVSLSFFTTVGCGSIAFIFISLMCYFGKNTVDLKKKEEDI